MRKFIASLKKATPSHEIVLHLIQRLANILVGSYVYNVGKIEDGSAIILNCDGAGQVKGFLDTVESTISLELEDIATTTVYLVVKTNTTTTITLSGSGLKFVDLDNQAAPATTLALSCGNTYNEISMIHCNEHDGASKVILVVKK